MNDKQPLTSEVQGDPHHRLGSRERSLFLPLLSVFLCVLVLTQAASFFFLFGRLEAVRGKLEAVKVEGVRRESFISREVELLKSRVQMLVEDHPFTHDSTIQRHHLLHAPPHPPPHPPPPVLRGPSPPSEPPKVLKSHPRDSNTRVKRRASDPSYGINGAIGEAGNEDEELSVQLQGERSDNEGEIVKSWLDLTSYARIPVSTFFIFPFVYSDVF
ncbi:uncharacterized protein LOC121872803 [Homarus americanus]|uniref:uncharacterized protein LOC121872803 n=1 Tax=Homarus americanus TaxID=6706 RepID=UPI001C473266|nr:uncharacterized protein LOC121872803 [Homarus americanus]